MTFAKRLRKGVRRGEITCSVRIWTRPRVRIGARYRMEEGAIEIFRVHSDGSEEVLATIGPGNYFGEIGPMLNLPRSASARAAVPTRLLGLTVRTFRARFPRTQKDAQNVPA